MGLDLVARKAQHAEEALLIETQVKPVPGEAPFQLADLSDQLKYPVVKFLSAFALFDNSVQLARLREAFDCHAAVSCHPGMEQLATQRGLKQRWVERFRF